MAGSGSCVLSEELVAFLGGGLAVIVASRDGDLRPEIGRRWGLIVDDERRRLTLSVGAAPRSQMHANLESNGAIAITCSRPSTYRTVQLKGSAVELRTPTDDELAAVRRHLESFVAEVEQVGVRPDGARSFLGHELLSVTIELRGVYDQTPGPNAGGRL